nr:MAG TPA: hypothetical protein [Caudoviricetes sp.]DAO86607.1 MAG TPA: hypothetical protein [Caudoviricetes sp.]DAS07827.1 MAG TPA: hypothetical protein [Caudoviricetes sp.]
MDWSSKDWQSNGKVLISNESQGLRKKIFSV